MEIILTDEQKKAFQEMFRVEEADLEAKIQEYIIGIAENHIKQQINERLLGMSDVEKKQIIDTQDELKEM